MHGGDQERGMRSGTENIYGITGMAVAFAKSMEEMAERKTKILEVKRYFIDRLTSELQDIKLNSCLLYTSPSPRDKRQSRMPSSA